MLATTTRDPLSLVFAALADPTRRAILKRLSLGTSTVSEIAADFREVMSLPAVTKHLKVLERAKLVQKSRDAQFRPCQIDTEALKEAIDWLEPYRVQWEARFDRLEAYLKETTATPTPQKKSHPEKKLSQRNHRKGSATHARKKTK